MWKKANRGFTLVEMVIVLVVIAILAAIAIPVTLNIIDSSNDYDTKLMAKTIMNAVQTEFDQLAADNELWYSINGQKGIILNKFRKNHGNTENGYNSGSEFSDGFISISDTDPVDDIFKLIDGSEDINMLFVGAGNVYTYYAGDDRDKMYNAYVIVFQMKDDSQPIYFYDGKKVSTEWPFQTPDVNKPDKHDGQNFILKNLSNVKLQLYALRMSQKKGCNKYWKETIMPKVRDQQ